MTDTRVTSGYDVSISFEVGHGDQAMLSGNSYNVSGGAAGFQGTKSWDGDGNSMESGSWGIGSSDFGSGSAGTSTTFSTHPVGANNVTSVPSGSGLIYMGL